MARLGTFLFMLGVITAQRMPTMREVLAANGITDFRRYPDYFLNAAAAPLTPLQRYIHIGYHINPSAQGLFVLSRDLKVLGELYGWELVTLPNESIVYANSQVHFTPTHSLEISVFNPVTRKDKQIYPPKPYQPIRKAFIDRVRKVYSERGEAWFREHNHHMNPEMFDSSLMGEIAIDRAQNAVSFNVRYGEPDNANDPVPFTQRVLVTCSPTNQTERLQCKESGQ